MNCDYPDCGLKAEYKCAICNSSLCEQHAKDHAITYFGKYEFPLDNDNFLRKT